MTASLPPQTEEFQIDRALELVRAAIQPYPKAAMFELAEEGFSSLFQQVIACLLSVRTYDEVSIEAARRLFAVAPGPAEIAQLSLEKVDRLIAPVTFGERKAEQIGEIARRTLDEFGGELPCDSEVVLSFNGIGPKCTNLALGIACGQPRISVDIHVHRVTNRWGYVQTSRPELTMTALEQVLPQRYWIEINSLLVPFGKHICTGERPRCSTCPLRAMCPKRGVTAHR
jgi:endonuclease-3